MAQVYEVEFNGQTYEVEANSPEEAAAVFAPEQQPAAPAQQPAPQQPASYAQQAMQRGPTGFGSMTAVNPASAEPAAEAARSYGSGMVEGVHRLMAGGKQLYGAVSDFFTREHVAGRGKKDLYTAQELLREAVASAEAEEAGRFMPGREAAAQLTSAGTLALAPEAALPRATTVIGALAKNFLSGGLGGAFTFDPEGSKLDDTLGGGAANAVLGVVPSLPPAIKNVVGRGLARINNEGRTAARVARAQSALPNTPFSLAQRTGVPELIYLEHRAYDLDQVNFFADQTDQFIADAANALRQPLRPGQTLGGDAAILKEAMDDHIGSIRQNASRTFEYGVSRAAATAGPDVTIPIDNFRNEIRSVLDEAKSYARVRDKPPIKESYIAHLESLLQPDKKAMSIKDLSLTLKELTALQKSDDPIAKALGTRLRNQGLEADLDGLQNMQQQDEAIKTLLDTRAEYRRAMQAANALSEAATYKMLDGATEPREMIERFASYSPSKQENIRDFMAQHSPALLRSLKQGVIDDAVSRSGVIREAADSQRSLDELQKALFDGDVMRTSGLWSPRELERIEGIKDGLRVIKNARPNVGSSGTPIAPEDVAINLISRSGPFMARFITRALTSARASDFFIDPNIYQMMTKMNRSTTGTATNLATRAALMAYLQENYPETEVEVERQ